MAELCFFFKVSKVVTIFLRFQRCLLFVFFICFAFAFNLANLQ